MGLYVGRSQNVEMIVAERHTDRASERLDDTFHMVERVLGIVPKDGHVARTEGARH